LLYTAKLAIPKSTPKDKPVDRTVEVEQPVLLAIQVRFPAGCLGLVGAAVYYGELQVWPSQEADWVEGEDEAVWDVPMMVFREAPYTLTLKGYNLDTDYQHAVWFRIVAVERRWVRWMPLLAAFTQAFRRLIGL